MINNKHLISLVNKIEGCSNHTTHHEAWRNIRNSSYTQQSHSVSCDYHFLKDGWHRFTGSAGTKLYTGCPDYRNRCGTYYPAGIAGGSYPQLPGQSSTLTLRFNTRNYQHYCYSYSGSVAVTNCGKFFIHKFNGIAWNSCNFGVCTE